MKTIRVLVNEHLLIEQVLHCLEKLIERCVSQGRLEGAPARDVIVFFRGFIERCHYFKEESELLRRVRAAGISPERCLDCPLFRRREEGCLHVKAMEEAIDLASRGDAAALKQFIEHAQAYIELLLEYIANEDVNGRVKTSH